MIRSLLNLRTTVSVLVMLVTGETIDAQSSESRGYDEPYRPQYHFSPASGWIGDPDGLLHYHDRYSMFWWGKATSTDLVHYDQESTLVMTGGPANVSYFSGSVVVDKHNTAGFGANAQVAIYTLFDKSTKKQPQAISFSSDGRDFRFFPGNPVLDIGSTEFRDPTVFWHAATSKWIMVVALAREQKIQIYSSSDLKTWTLMSDFGARGREHKVWECPDLFQLPVDGNPSNKKWILVVSMDWSHEEYYIGDFDGKTFVASDNGAHHQSEPSEVNFVDQGLDFYASRTFRDYDDTLTHTTSLGWIASWSYANQVPSAWGKGFWSIPRDLELKSYPEGIRLLQKPIERLTSLRRAPIAFVTQLSEGTTVLRRFQPERNVYEIDATFGTDVPNRFGFDLCVGDGRKMSIRYDSRSQNLTIDRSNTAAVQIPDFARKTSTLVAPVNRRLRLHIYVDKSSVEIFVNEGKEVFTLLTYAGDGQTEIDMFAEHPGTVMDFKAWKLDSIWPQTP